MDMQRLVDFELETGGGVVAVDRKQSSVLPPT